MIKVLLFAQLADLAETNALEYDFEQDMTPRSLVKSMVGTAPQALTDVLQHDLVMVAANEVMIDWDKPLEDGDTVAFLPPFSGG